jgi:acyl carrier protein
MTQYYSTPIDLVAGALGAAKESLNENSHMGQHPDWDSMKQLDVILAIEAQYNISVPLDETMKYNNMPAITELYERLTGKTSLKKGWKERFKNTKIGKIFLK